MKNKKLLVMSLVFLMIFALFAGCGEKAATSGGSLSAKEIIAKSSEAMKDIDNYKAKMAMDTEMGVEGQSMTMKMDGTIDTFMKPMKMKMVMNIEIPMMGNMNMDTYVVQEGDNLVTYTKNAMGTWQKSTLPFSEELLEQYSQTQYAEKFNDSLKKAKIVAEEAVEGFNCWKIDVTIDGASLMDIMESMQGGQDLTGVFPTEDLKKLGNMTASLWIAKDSFYQVKVDMDMTSAMKSMMKDMGVDLKKMVISMITYDFGKATDFTLPNEAKNAPEIAM